MAKNKLFEVLRHYGYKGKKGVGRQSILCPFHDDRHPSGSANWETGRFLCFACDYRGNALDLVMQKEGCDLDDAVRRVELL